MIIYVYICSFYFTEGLFTNKSFTKWEAWKPDRYPGIRESPFFGGEHKSVLFNTKVFWFLCSSPIRGAFRHKFCNRSMSCIWTGHTCSWEGIIKNFQPSQPAILRFLPFLKGWIFVTFSKVGTVTNPTFGDFQRSRIESPGPQKATLPWARLSRVLWNGNSPPAGQGTPWMRGLKTQAWIQFHCF